MPPRLSVVMAVRNGAPYLRQAIESVLEQSYRDFEFLIVDDASTDDTVDIVRAYSDSRIHLIRNDTNLGPFAAANVALERARGTYLARMDGDDVSLPNRFARQVEALDAAPDVVLVSSEYDVIDGNGRVLPGSRDDRRAADSEVIAWHLRFYNYLGGHSQVMFRRDAALAVGGYPTELRYSQDYAMWLRLLDHGRIVILPEVLLQYRVHAHAISRTLAQTQREHSLPATTRALSRLLHRDVQPEVVRDLRTLYVEMQRDLEHLPDVVRTLDRAYAAFATTERPARSTLREIRTFVAARLFQHALYALKHRRWTHARIAFGAAFRWAPSTASRLLTRTMLSRGARVVARNTHRASPRR